MYCKNCGNLMDDQAAFCVKCGVAKGMGNNYCQNCRTPRESGSRCLHDVRSAVHSSRKSGCAEVEAGRWTGSEFSSVRGAYTISISETIRER